MLWIQTAHQEADDHVAFRGTLELSRPAQVEFRILGASWYTAWLDGEFWLDGPPRFTLDHPEYDPRTITLQPGRHVVAFHVQYIGVETRLLPEMPPFLHCTAWADGRELKLEWKCLRLPGLRRRLMRLSPEFGWLEWNHTPANPDGWQATDFDDAAWETPVRAATPLGEMRRLMAGGCRSFTHRLEPIAQGPLAHVYGYEFDDIPARFFLRDLTCDRHPAKGVWRRYDLGRVRLARPRFTLELPPGATVEFAYAEALWHGRVPPYINLSGGRSANLDHFEARGGRQVFMPLHPKGGRFVEVHILLPHVEDPAAAYALEDLRFIDEQFIERAYFDEPVGSFECGDELLDRIWRVGIETLRGCAEDAVIDNPTRERGQWTGDVVTVGLEITAAGWSDLRLLRRALVHSAYCARRDGLIAGLTPGHISYLCSYSVQWVNACLTYFQHTGDRSLIDEMYPYAQRNLAAFGRFISPDGLTQTAQPGHELEGGPNDIGWVFVDWGYVGNPGPSDMAMNLHFLNCLRAMVRWSRLIGHDEHITHYEGVAARFESLVRAWFERELASGAGWGTIGYHRAVLGLRAGVIPAGRERECIDHIKGHMLACFPNDRDAPRNDDPTRHCPQLITPYFAHYAMPPLIEHGEMDFVLDQYRRCWGWALEDGRTTWVEVFDTRWSHCHQWAGCPTWQLSRYALGLHAHFDQGPATYVLNLKPGSLPRAKGRLPLGEGAIDIEWTRAGGTIDYRVETRQPIRIIRPAETVNGDPRVVEVDGRWRADLTG